jgi:hypothetical protein
MKQMIFRFESHLTKEKTKKLKVPSLIKSETIIIIIHPFEILVVHEPCTSYNG